MADMKITLDVDVENFKESLEFLYKDCVELLDSFMSNCKFLNNTVVINIDFDGMLFHGYKLADLIKDYNENYDDDLTFFIESSAFKVWDMSLEQLTNLLYDLDDGYEELINEYDHAFICEYLEENKKLPERDLYVVSLGETNREAQLETFGEYLWENYLDFSDRLESDESLSELSSYITINYVALARDFISEWEETSTYAYRSL